MTRDAQLMVAGRAEAARRSPGIAPWRLRLNIRTLALVAVLMLLSATAPRAATIHVDDSGGGDYVTIQEGVDAAADGDIVLVLPGTYDGPGNQHVDLQAKSITIESAGGPDVTTIVGTAMFHDDGGMFVLTSAATAHVVIEGFTIRDARVYEAGGGAIYCGNSAITVRDCVFEDCRAHTDYWEVEGNGGAIYIEGGALAEQSTIEDCVFARCAAYGPVGGAIYVEDASVTIARCSFNECSASHCGSGVNIEGPLPCVVTDCSFFGNTCVWDWRTGVIAAWDPSWSSPCDVSIRNCTFVANYTRRWLFYLTDGVTMEHCIIAFNTSDSDPCDLISGSAAYTTQCVVFQNEHGDSLGASHADNLFVDPLFCGFPSGDLSLCADSPCLPQSADNPWGVLVGALDAGCGDCYSIVEPMSWGAIKALYR